jgi:glycosyltransferase involved in cell wall biosynthesis
MKILQSGNANFGYVLAKELRKRGIETDLLISKASISGVGIYGISASINDPLTHDKDLKSYPDWIIFDDIDKKSKVFSIAKLMKNYDIIHAYQATPIHAMISGKPYVISTGGDDLRKKVFEKSLTGFFLKRSYKKAKRVVYIWPIAKPYIEKLGLQNSQYIPRVWDIQSFVRKNLRKSTDETLTIFFPTAESWELKGNDKFLKAFVRLCKEDLKVFLYFIDWGEDSEKAKTILSIPKVAKRVKIIPGPISRQEMVKYMEKSDILADQFNIGSFTRVGIEAFFFGIPILINLDEKLYMELHGDIPSILNCKTEDEIYLKLKEALNSKEELPKIAEKAKQWALKHFDLQKNVEKYIEIYESILKK